LDGALADGDAELEQLAPDPLGAPPGIVARHPRDQLLDLRADAWTADPRARPPPPEQAPAPAVPPHDRLRCDHEQVPAPVAASQAGQQPEQLVAGTQPRAPARGAGQDGELLAQEEVLCDEIAAVADCGAEQSHEKEQRLDHRRP
jgi:hypothetical protein